mgnify:CR=1 FL=1
MAEKKYVEIDKVVSEIKRFVGYIDDDMLNRLEIATRRIPAADVRPVVLCKDCMYCQKDKLGRWCFNDYENELRDEDFCSHGKRKESKT